MSLIPSKRQHHFRPLCHLYLFILVFIYPSHPACWAAREMPPALCMGGSDPPGSSPHPWVPSWPRDVAVAPWPRAAQCWLARWDRSGKPGRTPPCPWLQTPPEPQVPRSQVLEVIGKILWCLLGAFSLLGTFLSMPCQGHVHAPSIRTCGGRRKPHAHGMPASHQLHQ